MFGHEKICRSIDRGQLNGDPRLFKDGPKEILRASRDADKISNYVLALEKDRMPSNIEKLPEVAKVQPQTAPARRMRRVRAAGGRERG